MRDRAGDHDRLGRWGGAAAAGAAAVASGVRGALAMLRRGDPSLLGAVAWWGFDIAVLWACLRAFGEAPTVAVITMAYFAGTLGNLLPLPGGVGGVEGGMIGALIGFGVPGPGRGVGAVLPRLLVLAADGARALAYIQLRRRIRAWDQPPPAASA